MYSKAELDAWDKEYFWHPFTQMKVYEAEDNLLIERGEGSYLIDIAGNRYLDGVSSIWLTVHGYNHAHISNAVKAQLDKIAHSTTLGQGSVPAAVLAKKLVEVAPPGLSKVFFSDDGATSVEVALKIAYQYWCQKDADNRDKYKFISLQEGYHGDTIGSVSVGGVESFHSLFKPYMFPGYKAPVPYCYRCPLGEDRETCGLRCAREVEGILALYHHEIAALIMEPGMICAGGMIDVPAGYLSYVRQLCDKYDILLILDEVAVGFGRTGTMFACEQEGVAPDILCLSKGITGGYMPLAATLVREKIYQAFWGEESKKFTHGHSYTGNQLACAAAIANLEVFEQEDVLAALQPKIDLLRQGLEEFKALEHVGDVRQRGFLVGIELVKDKSTREPFPPEFQLGHKVILAARRHGVILRPILDVIEIVPHLSVSETELQKILTAAKRAIEEITQGQGSI